MIIVRYCVAEALRNRYIIHMVITERSNEQCALSTEWETGYGRQTD